MGKKLLSALMALAALAVLFPAARAAAQETSVSGTSRTYLQLRETVNGNNLAPLFEYLDLNVGNVAGRENISFHAAGWVRLDLGDESGEDSFEQDLSYAYLSLSLADSTLLNLGRVYVFEGVASEQVDGFYAKAFLPAGFGAALFGGSPVEADFDDRGGDSVYGARISNRRDNLFEIGASYLKEENDGGDFREESGVDIWIRPIRQVQVHGLSAYNHETSGWMEHTYHLNVHPSKGLRINGMYSSIDYEHFFFATTLSAFDITSIDPRESVQSVGGSAEYTFATPVTVAVEYKNFDYDLSGSADFYGGTVRYAKKGYAGGLSVHRMDGQTERLKYYQLRAYTTKDFGDYDVTLDLFDVNYDEEIKGVKNAYALVGAVGYDISPEARVGVDIEYAENPFFDEEVKGFFKFIYRFAKGT